MALSCHYDVRYLLLPLVVFIPSFSPDVEGNNSNFMINESKLLFVGVLSALFLMASLRIQLFCCSASHRRLELRFGRPALSIPLTLSLITTLLLPLSSFWSAYLVIFIMSLWSDAIHSFFSRFSHTEERLVLLPLVQPTTHQLQVAVDEAPTLDELR